MSLSWKSNFTNTEVRIFRDKVIAGLLKTSIWKNEGYGELDGSLVKFKTRGFWQKSTDIKDIDGEKLLGQIKFHFFKGSASIVYNYISYDWKFQSWSRRKWYVTNGDDRADLQLKKFWQREGAIENEGIPAAVILAAIYVHMHFRKMSAMA